MILPVFIYGTLHPDRAPASIADTAKLLRSIGNAAIHAKLFDLGEYPGVVLTANPEDIVHGELFLLPEVGTDAVLTRLDHYEDFRVDDPHQSLFLREMATATLEDGTRQQCWVYTFNHSVGPLE